MFLPGAAGILRSSPRPKQHLGVLERAGLVTREARGRERVCRLNPAALRDAQDWLEFHTRFWPERLDALGALVETGADEEGERR